MRYKLPVMLVAATAAALSGGVAMASTHAQAARPVAVQPAAKRTDKLTDCDARQLKVTAADGEASMHHVDIELRVRNLDVKNSCRIPGQPKVQVTSRTTLKPMATTPGFGTGKAIVLGPDTSATMYLRTDSSAAPVPGGVTCTTPGFLKITLPGKAVHRETTDTSDYNFVACGGLNIESPLAAGN
jgi:glucose/arabinose dehydrogenase